MATTQPPVPTLKDGENFNVNCAAEQCHQPIQLLIPKIETINQRTFSSYHFSHEELQRCPFCGQAYIFQLLKLGPQGMQFCFRPVQEAPEKRIIDVSNGDPNMDRKLRGIN